MASATTSLPALLQFSLLGLMPDALVVQLRVSSPSTRGLGELP